MSMKVVTHICWINCLYFGDTLSSHKVFIKTLIDRGIGQLLGHG